MIRPKLPTGLAARDEFRTRVWRVIDRPLSEGLEAAVRAVVARHHLPAAVEIAEDAASFDRLLQRGCDAAGDPPVRALLLRLPANDTRLAVSAPVALCDDRSLDLIGAEIAATLAGRPLPPVRPFAAHLDWLRCRATGSDGAIDLAWWRRTLADAPRTRFPLDHIDAGQPALAAAESLALAPELAALLAGIGAAADDSAPDPLMAPAAAALAVLVQRYTDDDDVLPGCEMSTRRPGADAAVVGPCAPAIPVRLDLSGDPDGETMLARARAAVEAAWAHRLLPHHCLSEIIDEIGLGPLLPIALAVRRAPPPGDGMTELPGPPAALHARLRFEVRLGADGTARLDCAGRCEPEAARQLLSGWSRLLEGLLLSPRVRVAGIDVLSDAERHRLLVTFNDTARDFPDPPAIRLIEAQVRTAPERIALVHGERTLTYADLDHAADRLATALVQRGIGRGARVGLLLQRGPEMFVTVLAVLKAGAAYVPLDPAAPSDRLGFILADSGASLLVTQAALLDRLDGAGPARLTLDRDPWDAAAMPSPIAVIAPEDSAYFIYTSGSTGRPKGVAITHRAMTNFLLSMRETPGLAASDTMLLVNSIAFDVTVLEFFLPLMVGARMVIAGAAEAGDGAALVRLIGRHAVNVVQAGPTRLRLMLEAGWAPGPRLRILTGSEPIPRSLTDQLAPFGEVWNLYGPTETTVWCACHRVAPGAGPVPIGRPIANMQFHVLDRAGQLAPLGAAGELGIAGVGVANGYFNRPELSAARFPPNPFGPGRMHLSGDRVRWRRDGTLEFLSRLDHQVKLRGFRIELGEVEAVLLSHPDVRQAAVVLRKLRTGEDALIAYVVPVDPQAASAIEHDLPGLLGAWLPRYMLPRATVLLPELPLLPNGKIDRRGLAALPPPSDAAKPDQASAASMEQRLVAIWRGVLKLPAVGPHDNFFDLGGDSLLALGLMAEVLRQTGRELPITAIYDSATPAAMAKVLAAGDPPPRDSCLVPLKSGHGPPLFIMPDIGGSVMRLHDLARQLEVGGPIYGIEARGLDGAAPPLERIEDMAAFHLAEIRRSQPGGPPRLAGFAFGGLVALEMAQQMTRAGETVGSLLLLDAYPHPRFWPLRWKALSLWALARAVLSPATWRRIRRHYEGGGQNPLPDQQVSRAAARFRKVVMLPLNMGFVVWFLQCFLGEEDAPSQGRPVVTPAIERVRQANTQAFAAYRPAAYSGEMIVVKGLEKTHPPFETSVFWRTLAGKIRVVNVAGDPAQLRQSERVTLLANALSAALRR